MIKPRAHAGMNTREALEIARQLGFIIEPVRRTGEIRVREPGGKPCLVQDHARYRKDAPRVLTTMLQRAQKARDHIALCMAELEKS